MMFEIVFRNTFVAHERAFLGYFSFRLTRIGTILSLRCLVLLIVICLYNIDKKTILDFIKRDFSKEVMLKFFSIISAGTDVLSLDINK
jgi:hypothetical protein